MNVKLRPYQEDIVIEGIEIITQYHLLYLAMSTRTGKTLTALSIADSIGAQRVLFITKRKAKSSITDDYNSGSFGYKLDIVSVDSVHKVDQSYDLIIIDEAHCIGSFPKPNKRAKSIKKVVGDTRASQIILEIAGVYQPKAKLDVGGNITINVTKRYIEGAKALAKKLVKGVTKGYSSIADEGEWAMEEAHRESEPD